MKILPMLALLIAFPIWGVPSVPISPISLPRITESVRPLQENRLDDSGDIYLQNICTATSIDAKRHLWITAAHCVANEDRSEVAEGPFMIDRQPVVVRKIAFGDDLAILYTPDYSRPALKIAKNAPDYGDQIMLWGHPFGFNEIVFVRGFVAAPSVGIGNRHYLLFSAPIAPGNSGSSVLNRKNEIISIAQVVFALFPAFEPVGGGVPFDVLKAFMVGV